MIKSLTDTVHYQGVALKEIDKSLREKFGFNELNPLLNTKLDISELPNILENINIEIEKRPTNEELNHILNLKVDKNEFEQYLNTKPSTNDLYNTRKKVEENQKNIESFMDNIHKILEGYNSLKNEIEKIKIDLNKKSNLEDVAEALELKADNDIINEINTIKKNIENDINLIREQIEEKNNKKNFSFIEEINEKIEEINKNKCDMNDFKLMSDAFQDIKLNLSQRVDDIDNDLDMDFENIFNSKKDFFNEVKTPQENNKENIDNNIPNKIKLYSIQENNLFNIKRSFRLQSILQNNYIGFQTNTLECSICYRKIQNYGLLSNCDDVFCYDCIKQWRTEAISKNKREMFRRCPICNFESPMLIKSKNYVSGEEKKKKIL